MRDTQKSQLISTQLRQIAEQAIRNPDQVFISLAHRMDVDFLHEAYRRVRKDGAPGLSRVTAKEYAENLEENLADLHRRLKDRCYTAPLIKRVWIDKEAGKQRPIGITTVITNCTDRQLAFGMDRGGSSFSPLSRPALRGSEDPMRLGR